MCGGRKLPAGSCYHGEGGCHGEGGHIYLKETPVRGLLHLSILNLVKNGPVYGAEIYRALKEKYNIEAPKAIIYGLLRRMEYAGFLASTWDVEGGGPARRKYKITEEGLDYLKDSLENLRKVKGVIDILLAEDIGKA
jgi:DNA-binding PadR family transcriptional regulator